MCLLVNRSHHAPRVEEVVGTLQLRLATGDRRLSGPIDAGGDRGVLSREVLVWLKVARRDVEFPRPIVLSNFSF